KRSMKINLGVLTIFFRYNPLAWRLGLCVATAKSFSVNRQIICTLAGPFASLTIATIACYFTFAYDMHGFLKLFLIIFLGSAFLDLLINLIPDETPINLYDGSITYNDGYSLKQLFYYKQLPKAYRKAADLYNEQNFADAAVLFENCLPETKDENVYRLAISSYLQDKNYAKVKELSDVFVLTGKMNSDDFSNMAFSYSEIGYNDEALKLYDDSLQLNPDNNYSLNNKGYTLNHIGKFEEAIPLFDKAIELDQNFAYSYNNRGLAKIKLGQTEEGLKDISHSFELEPNNSYGYRNLGIYHFDRNEFDEALRLFTKARELDDTTHLIDDLLNETRLKLTEKQ
ncbi:MAG: tetratricopeptide repeat protein, partial [Flavitalea sp.]